MARVAGADGAPSIQQAGPVFDLPEWVKIAVAAGGLVWGWLAPLDQLLILLIIMDIVSGLACAGINGVVNSDASFRGMLKKSLILLLVAMAHALDPHASLLFALAPVTVSLGNMVAAFFCINEVISITENAARSGVPIPKPLRDALEKVRT